MPHTLSILIPVYNEAKTVEQLIRRVAAVRFPIDREIIAVDDGSKDGSADVLALLEQEGVIRLIEHRVNRGKGAAIRTAIAQANGSILVIQDADLELEPNDLTTLLEPILAGETRVCFGTRFAAPVPAAIRRLPTYWANRLLNAVSNVLNGIRLTDFNTCYKMMTAEVMSRLSITENGFAIEPEMTTKIARLGYGIIERPIHYEPRSSAEGKKIQVLDFFKYIAAMLRYRFSRVPQLRSAPEASILKPA